MFNFRRRSNSKQCSLEIDNTGAGLLRTCLTAESDFFAMKLSKLSDFSLEVFYYLSSFIFLKSLNIFTARKSFKCVEMLVSQWRLLKQHVISALPSSRTSCLNILWVSAHVTAKPFFCMCLTIYISTRLDRRLWYGSSHDGGKVGEV